MTEILNFAQTASPITVLALAVLGLLYIIIKLLRGEGLLTSIRETQKEKYPELENLMSGIAELAVQNKALLDNHFKHEVPGMVDTLGRLETKIDKFVDVQSSHGERISKIEGIMNK